MPGSCVEADFWLHVGRILHLPFSLVGMLGNSLVIVCVLHTARMRTPINICFASLAVADFMVGLSLSLAVNFDKIAPPSGSFRRHACLWSLAFGTHSLLSAVFGVLVVSAKRWGQVVHWGSACWSLSSRAGSLVLVGGAWFCSSLLAVTILIWGKAGDTGRCAMDACLGLAHRVGLNIVAILAIVASSVFCLNLLRYIVHTRKAVHTMAPTTDALQRARQEERRLHTTIVTVVVILVSLWLPYVLVTSIPNLKDTLDRCELRVWALVLIQLNSLVNPFIYAWRSRAYREAFVGLLPSRNSLPCYRNRINPDVVIHVY